MLPLAVKYWPTPRASPNENRGTRDYGRKGGRALSEVSCSWATPTSRDYKDGACVDANVPTNALLGRQVVRWSSPRSSDGAKGGPGMKFGAGGVPLPTQAAAAGEKIRFSRGPQDPENWKRGGPTSPGSRVLNPQFVEALMGWPIGWTAFASSETVSSPPRQPSPSRYWRIVWV